MRTTSLRVDKAVGKNKRHTQQLRPTQRRVFFVVTISIPVVFFVSLELALRLFNYGPNLSLFGRQEIRGQTYCVLNPDVKFRYFGTMKFTPSTSIHYFLMPKPRGLYRIFTLGGSTTVGYPYYFNGSFSAFLAQRLTTLFPNREIEVINLGMTATNSFTALHFARELGQYQPDLIIDYDGHNEFYGALGVASNQTISSFRFVTLLYLRLVHFRTFLLLRDAVQKIVELFINTENAVSRGTIMERLARGKNVPYGSPLYDAAYSIFRDNLEDLKNYCRSAGIPLILGTQVSNLRDQPPFVSEDLSGSAEQQTFYQQFYRSGARLESKGLLDSAIVLFRSAIAAEPLNADAHYRLARCLDAKGRKREALSEYIVARDYDELRFRTDSKFNDLIRSMDDHKHCFVADIEAVFETHSPDSVIGRNLIIDHLHPTSRGNFLIARDYAQVMQKHGLLATQQEWNTADTVNEDELWKNRLVTDLDELLALQSVKVVTSGWPFKKQSATIDYVPSSDTLDYLAQSLAIGSSGWLDAHMQAASFYRAHADWAHVEWEYKTIIFTYPHLVEPYLDLAWAYFQQHKFDEMKAVLLRSLQIHPTLLAYNALGHIMLDKGDPLAALEYLEKTHDFPQKPDEKLENEFLISYALANAGEVEKAKTRLMGILTSSPNYQPAIQLLADINRRLARK
jgi:tetratricopeptide (TPR) repeat protein